MHPTFILCCSLATPMELESGNYLHTVAAPHSYPPSPLPKTFTNKRPDLHESSALVSSSMIPSRGGASMVTALRKYLRRAPVGSRNKVPFSTLQSWYYWWLVSYKISFCLASWRRWCHDHSFQHRMGNFIRFVPSLLNTFHECWSYCQSLLQRPKRFLCDELRWTRMSSSEQLPHLFLLCWFTLHRCCSRITNESRRWIELDRRSCYSHFISWLASFAPQSRWVQIERYSTRWWWDYWNYWVCLVRRIHLVQISSLVVNLGLSTRVAAFTVWWLSTRPPANRGISSIFLITQLLASFTLFVISRKR